MLYSPARMTIVDDQFVHDLTAFARSYPSDPTGKHFMTLGDPQNWARRVAHDIAIATERVGSTGAICDVGGGYGLFAAGCAQLGMRSILIDDFYEQESYGILEAVQTLLRDAGVEMVRRDVLLDDLGLEPDSLDVVASMHVLEHLPISPKPAFTQMVNALKPGGSFLLAGPNAVNLRKRIAVPLGKQGWSPIEDWYSGERFRGHVREPRVQDFRYIAKDLGLVNAEIRGANFMATTAAIESERRWLRALAPALDGVMRQRPSLCSELYMLAEKPS
jgi:2-polyprenyl-3-methyl-5-hydroxy-6-metoxy-1,4-benzoquinol methylase